MRERLRFASRGAGAHSSLAIVFIDLVGFGGVVLVLNAASQTRPDRSLVVVPIRRRRRWRAAGAEIGLGVLADPDKLEDLLGRMVMCEAPTSIIGHPDVMACHARTFPRTLTSKSAWSAKQRSSGES